MAEYIEREALIQTIQKDPWIGAQGKDYALYDIAEQPTADVVEVIRCADCIYSNDDGTICHYSVGLSTRPYRFCSEGERKGGTD